MSLARRLALATAVAVSILSVAAGDVVFADPAGPTDYRSEIVAIEPPTETIDVRILGGDSFLQLTVDPGTEAMVLGYQAEPYLWFRDDGTVLENRNSPTTHLNEERYGSEFPDFADADADPDWVEVAADGSYAWHDHRAHWMLEIRPAGKGPGDQILEAVVPLVVDGVEVDVTVASTWQAPPSPLPMLLGGVLGAVATGLAWIGSNAARVRRWTLVGVPVALLASVIGWIDYTSLPAETGTPATTWALPMIALVALVAASLARPTDRFWGAAGAILGGAQLALWSWLELDGIGSALLPTSAPAALHRLTVVFAGVAGIGLSVTGLVVLTRLLRPAPARRGELVADGAAPR